MVIKLGGALSEVSTVGIEAAELDVVELLLPDAVEPDEIQEIMPGSLVEFLHLLLSVLVEDVLLEV